MKLLKSFASQARSVIGFTSKIKSEEQHVAALLGEKRTVFKKPARKLRWYSIVYVRNQVIIALAAMGYMFATPIGDVYRAWIRGSAMDEEKRKFIAFLDKEDREWAKRNGIDLTEDIR
ncbi:hypothetical protein HDE_02696 [Halotydeus destructor]|nr:hypothetical protein HDE_02696 [Halotydeus destructor]